MLTDQTSFHHFNDTRVDTALIIIDWHNSCHLKYTMYGMKHLLLLARTRQDMSIDVK